MAKVHRLPDHSDPVNDGEKRALEYLADNLPDSVTLIPNLTIPFALPQTPEEYDIIAVSPDAVFVIEVKDLAPSLEFTEQEMLIGGSVRKNPYLTTRIKAQKLRTRLNGLLPWFGTGGWVEHVVVLARQPRSLRICDAMKNRIEVLPLSTPLIAPGTSLLQQKYHGQLDGRAEEIIEAIVGVARTRQLPTVFGNYEGTSPLFESGGLVAWRARHRLSSVEAILEIHRLPAGLPRAQLGEWRTDVLRMFEIAGEIGPSADFDAPRDVFELDDGSIVIVWPDRDQNTIDHFSRQMAEPGADFNPVRARRVAEGFAGAVHHLHSRGWSLGGAPLSHNLVVRPTGRGGVILGSPVPIRGGDTTEDLKWLGRIISDLARMVDDPLLKELAEALTGAKDDERPSAGLVRARLEGAVESFAGGSKTARSDRPDVEPARFEVLEKLASHRYGTTVRARDKQLDRRVILKRESGRPEVSWALREYRALSMPAVANNPHSVSVLAGGETSTGSYVVTENLDGPTLATLIDQGELQDPQSAAAVVAQLLSLLDAVHPDIERIEALISGVDGVLPLSVQEEIGELRDAGLAHNHLEPSNIFVVKSRGVVVADFVRAARFGDVIPHRTSQYWPPGQSTEISDPRADLYAVGVLLLRMLSTTASGVSAAGPPSSPAVADLVDVALKATSEDPEERYRTAKEFLDAVTSVVAVGEMPGINEDVLSIQQEIEALLSEGRFDDALARCPMDWTQTIRRIVEKQVLANRVGAVLLEIEGLTLHYDGMVEIGPGMTGGNNKHDGGKAGSYIVTIPGGGVLEIRVCSAVVQGVIERWVGVEQGFGYPASMQHAVRSHRMTVYGAGGDQWMEISQSQLKKNPRHENEATKKLVTEPGLSAPLGDFTAREILARFGVTALGTRGEVLGDTKQRRGYLAAVFGSDAEHAPAVVHFISRLVPLYMEVREA